MSLYSTPKRFKGATLRYILALRVERVSSNGPTRFIPIVAPNRAIELSGTDPVMTFQDGSGHWQNWLGKIIGDRYLGYELPFYPREDFPNGGVPTFRIYDLVGSNIGYHLFTNTVPPHPVLFNFDGTRFRITADGNPIPLSAIANHEKINRLYLPVELSWVGVGIGFDVIRNHLASDVAVIGIGMGQRNLHLVTNPADEPIHLGWDDLATPDPSFSVPDSGLDPTTEQILEAMIADITSLAYPNSDQVSLVRYRNNSIDPTQTFFGLRYRVEVITTDFTEEPSNPNPYRRPLSNIVFMPDQRLAQSTALFGGNYVGAVNRGSAVGDTITNTINAEKKVSTYKASSNIAGSVPSSNGYDFQSYQRFLKDAASLITSNSPDQLRLYEIQALKRKIIIYPSYPDSGGDTNIYHHKRFSITGIWHNDLQQWLTPNDFPISGYISGSAPFIFEQETDYYEATRQYEVVTNIKDFIRPTSSSDLSSPYNTFVFSGYPLATPNGASFTTQAWTYTDPKGSGSLYSRLGMVVNAGSIPAFLSEQNWENLATASVLLNFLQAKPIVPGVGGSVQVQAGSDTALFVGATSAALSAAIIGMYIHVRPVIATDRLTSFRITDYNPDFDGHGTKTITLDRDYPGVIGSAAITRSYIIDGPVTDNSELIVAFTEEDMTITV